MVYMFAVPGFAFAGLNYGLAGYFVVEGLAWTTPALGETGRWQGTLALPSSGDMVPAAAVPVRLAERVSGGLRASLAVMVLGMAYMFVAMQAGH
ncbi:MAG: hypothetical protein DLM54_10805 [Acidimicrobiales bacterium]|nr:MAG: hypothetical protein DLM54_10805 [Acidimicrobiales bacterium]